MKRLSLLLAGLLTLAVVVLQAPPAAAAGGPPSGGASMNCVPSGPSYILDGGHLKRVSAGDTLHCPAPVNAPGGSFGPHDRRAVQVPSPNPGDPCRFQYNAGVPLRFAGNYTADVPIPTGSPPPGWGSAGFDEIVTSAAFPDPNAYHEAIAPVDLFFQHAGTTDYYMPWTYEGAWTMQNGRLTCTNPTNQWRSPCNLAQGLIINCLIPEAQAVVGGQAPVALLGENLPNFVNGHFSGGDITSLPDARQQHPGLTNLKTCFYVTNMRVDGQLADPNEDIVFEKTVIGSTDVGEGRHVVYVFRVHVHRLETVLDFGDGTVSAPIGLNGTSPEDPAPFCTQNAPAGQQFVIAHTYHKYSPPGGFQVTIRHRYGVDLQEFWFDSNGTNRVDISNVVPPTEVVAAPAPFLMPVVQEEGVPIG